MKNPFNGEMTSGMLQYVFFREADGKSKEEINALLDMQKPFMHKQHELEMKLADQGWLLTEPIMRLPELQPD